MLQMRKDGNLVLSAYHLADPGYWTTQTIKKECESNLWS